MSMVLLIDGPLEGQHRELPLTGPIQHWEITGGPGAGVYGQRVTEYTVHSLVVFGRLMRFGTCAPDLDPEILNRVFWGRLATGFARDMAGPPDPPGPPPRATESGAERLIEAAMEWDDLIEAAAPMSYVMDAAELGKREREAEERLREAIAALREASSLPAVHADKPAGEQGGGEPERRDHHRALKAVDGVAGRVLRRNVAAERHRVSQRHIQAMPPRKSRRYRRVGQSQPDVQDDSGYYGGDSKPVMAVHGQPSPVPRHSRCIRWIRS